ncbi:MAG: hypothetical protein LC104_13465 [Bacteroidales bacterium]|nr:hypothetical protein [Bacteroidales bacterium]
MRRKWTWVAALVVAIAFAGSADAQPGQGRQGGSFGGRGGGIMMLITNAEVQKDINLTDDQKDKLASWYESHQDKIAAKTKDIPRNDFRKRMELMAELGKEAEKDVEKFLKPEQVQRIKQIGLQLQGNRALSSETVQKQLGVTEEQKEKFNKISEESREAFRKSFQQGQRPDFEKMRELQKANEEKYQGILTSDQKAKWKELVGEPFDTSKLRPQRGQGGERQQGSQQRRQRGNNNNN